MNIKNQMNLKFLGVSENEAFARVVASAFVTQLDPTIEEISDVKMAVSEAVTNCIVHGYEGSQGFVQINAKLIDNVVEIEVVDEGKGIKDIELARQPLYTSSSEPERSGMGFTVMETFMDNVDVISEIGKGTTVRMIKAFKR